MVRCFNIEVSADIPQNAKKICFSIQNYRCVKSNLSRNKYNSKTHITDSAARIVLEDNSSHFITNWLGTYLSSGGLVKVLGVDGRVLNVGDVIGQDLECISFLESI